MKILSVVGTRPQYIKAAMIEQELQKHDTEHVVVHTGQHYDVMMCEDFYKELPMPKPIANLQVNGKTFSETVNKMCIELVDVFKHLQPDLVIVYGDCTSTLAGAEAANRKGIRLAHVEAGLRCWNMAMIEETVRVRVDQIADVLLCPTKNALRNLTKECNVFARADNTGDVMLDAYLQYGALGIPSTRHDFIYCTLHRKEGRFGETVEALGTLDKQVVIPLHPRHKYTGVKIPENVEFIDPVGYYKSLYYVNNAFAVITDSGGVQREAHYANTPCLVVRDETEWIECNQPLLPVNSLNLMSSKFNKLVDEWKPTNDFIELWKPFGGGYAAKNIVKHLLEL